VFRLARQGMAAIAFYTLLPVPDRWAAEFETVSRYVLLVGALIAGLLTGADWGLGAIAMPPLPRCALLVLLWLWLTGGLHLDGAMDAADGLAVTDPTRRLEVMADSRSGAFGGMAAIAILLLKTTALVSLHYPTGWMLWLAAGWGRWGQQVAIALYPYLKPTGKGAFHKMALRSKWDILPGLALMLGVAIAPLFVIPDFPWQSLIPGLGGGAIALFLPAWFHHKLGGHTGDTYGAVVEWTEAFTLLLGTLALTTL